MGKFNIIAFSKTKKYKIIMFSLMALGSVLVIVGFIMMSSVSKTTLPRKLSLEALSGAQLVAGTENEYNVVLSQDEVIVVLTGTGTQVLSKPITFTPNANCKLLIESIAPMYREGPTMLRIKPSAPNHSTGTLVISCGSESSIVLYILTSFDEKAS
jgi:hypothetical protein